MNNIQCLVLFLCGFVCMVVSLVFTEANRRAKRTTKTGPIEFKYTTTELPIPKEHETKIEHVIVVENGVQKEHWYVYTYVVQPGWFLRSAHTDAESAIWQKKWSDNINFKKVETVLKETLP